MKYFYGFMAGCFLTGVMIFIGDINKMVFDEGSEYMVVGMNYTIFWFIFLLAMFAIIFQLNKYKDSKGRY